MNDRHEPHDEPIPHDRDRRGDTPPIDPERAAEALRDAAAIAVGLGIMAVNRVQAVRRQVARRERRSDVPPTG